MSVLPFNPSAVHLSSQPPHPPPASTSTQCAFFVSRPYGSDHALKKKKSSMRMAKEWMETTLSEEGSGRRANNIERAVAFRSWMVQADIPNLDESKLQLDNFWKATQRHAHINAGSHPQQITIQPVQFHAPLAAFPPLACCHLRPGQLLRFTISVQPRNDTHLALQSLFSLFFLCFLFATIRSPLNSFVFFLQLQNLHSLPANVLFENNELEVKKLQKMWVARVVLIAKSWKFDRHALWRPPTHPFPYLAHAFFVTLAQKM